MVDPATGTSNPAYPLIGQVVGGRYHIVSLIGEGGMGVVYKAEQRLGSTVRKVAVKTLHAELSRDPSITARFHREVGTVAQLEHPNTVRVYDFGSTDDGTLYIAMEFLDGKALNRVIETESPLEARRVGQIVRQIAGSLDEAHRQGIVHRDLKPENVLLIERAGEKDVVKLVDFGIAARTESAEREKEQKLTQQGMVLGTPPYMSPEQFTGKALDLRSDVYSLGVMVYEMLTAQLPFQADTAWQWATHHMTSPPRSFDETPGGARIPEALRRTVLKALSKEPADRQSSAGQFYTEFVASVGNMASTAPKAPALATNKTEAMPQATPLAMAPTAGMEALPPVPAIASPPVALPPGPPREATSTPNRSLVYGLSGVGAVLLIAMGVVALTTKRGSNDNAPLDVTPPVTSTAAPTGESPTESPSLTPEEAPAAAPEEAERPATTTPARPRPTATSKPAASKPATTPTASPSPSPAATPPAASSSAPATTSPPTPAPTATPAPSAPAQTAPAQTAPAQTTPSPTAPAAAPTPTPPVAQQPKPTPAAPSPAAPAGDACAACAKAAQGRDIPGAGRAYAQCTNPSGRRQCTGIVAQTAPRLAEAAAFNGQCDQARAIMAAASGMGVPEGRMAKARAACK